MSKKLYVKTYGCQMNVYDSARMADVLAPLGYAPVPAPDDADMVILNTCHIREKAAEKVYSELGRLNHLKAARRAQGHDMVIAVAGCVAQAEGDEVLRRAPFVDVVLGPQTYHRLPDMIARAARSPVVDTDFPAESKFDFLPEEAERNSEGRDISAYVTVQEGCDRFCTFCVVPYTRGAEFSRPVVEVVAEARRLVDSGTREITLLGQNVNAYHGAGADGDVSLAGLVRRLATIDGLERIRYATSHPRDMTDDLIAAHGDVEKLMPFLHLPVQSGSDRVLAAMNRRHSAEDYLRIVQRLRAARPDIALSSDFIVGFPGETDEDFADTMALVEAVDYAQAFSFKYSSRPGTPAADVKDQTPDAAKASRLEALQGLLGRQQIAFNKRFVGATLPVLFERPGRHAGQLVGRSPYMQWVHADASDTRIGRIADVEIDIAHRNSLGGRIPVSSSVHAGGETMIGEGLPA